MHTIMDDVRGYDKGNAGNQHIEHRLSCADGYPVTGGKVGKPADQQLDQRDKNSRRKLEQPITKQARGIFFRENLTPVYVGENTAQKPEGKHDRNGMDGIHEGKPDRDRQIDPARVPCPYMDIIPHMDRHAARRRVVVFFRINCTFKIARICVEIKGLPSHKAENSAKGKEADQKIAGKFHEPGSRPCKPLVCEFLNGFHLYHPGFMITRQFSIVNNNLMIIIKLLLLYRMQLIFYTLPLAE